MDCHLERNPFAVAADPEFLFLSPAYKRALETMAAGIAQRQGLVAVIGEAGLGKTLLLRALLRDRHPAKMKAVLLPHRERSPAGLVQALCREMMPSLEPEAPGLSPKQLQRALAREDEQGNTVVLLVDDAQDLADETLHQLHWLSNLETRSGKLLQIVLAGRPEFWELLERHEFRPLKQRVALVARLSPLTGEESRKYVRFRLDKAGLRDRPLFTKGALKGIVQRAAGIPRNINILGAQALKRGLDRRRNPVTGKIVAEAARDLGYAKKTDAWRRGLPAVAGVLVLLGFLTLAADYRVFGQKVETFLLSRPETSLSGSIAVGAVIEEGVSEAVIVAPSRRPALAAGGPFAVPEPRPVRETGGPLPPALENEIIRAAAGIEPQTRLPEKIGKTEEKGDEEIPKKSVSKTRESVPVVRVIREGDNFFRLVLEAYGTSNPALWDYVVRHNPRLKEVHRLRVGEKIVFPQWKARADFEEKAGESIGGPGFREKGEMTKAIDNRS